MATGRDTAPVTDALAAQLNLGDVDSGRLEHAMRFLVAQWSDFKSADEMTADMVSSGTAPDVLQAASVALSDNPALLDEAALDILSVGWNDPDMHLAARNSLDEASSRLPVIELGAIVVAAMYGLWLLTTRGRRSTTRTTRRQSDGTYEETETTEWYDPAGPLRAVVDLIRPPNADELPAPTSTAELPSPGCAPEKHEVVPGGTSE
jgi:hypothetical protein